MTATAASETTTATEITTAPADSGVCPFRQRFGRRLPRGFAERVSGMGWRTLIEEFAPSSDRFHLADLSRRPLGRGITAYEAILATRDAQGSGDFTAHRLTTRSCGDLTAMSEMLGQIGARVEVERFHQYEGQGFGGSESWCTILRATCGRRETWALGFGENSPESSIAALLNAATLLHLR